MRRPAPRERGACGGDELGMSGFTLIEVVAVMAIFGLLLAVALPRLPLAASRPQIEGIAFAVAAILEGDHNAALRRHAPVYARVDLGRRVVASGAGGRSLALPAGIVVKSVLAKTCLGSAVADRIVFLPDGTSCGGSILLGDHDRWVAVDVSWLTGTAAVAARPAS